MKIVDILLGKHRDPFTGELYEGLTKTVDVDKAVELIRRKFKPELERMELINDGAIILLSFEPTYADDQLRGYVGDYPDRSISEVLVFLNNLGYFPASVGYDLGSKQEHYKLKYTPAAFRRLISNEEPSYLTFRFEPKYDQAIQTPRYLYHITDSKYLENIKRIGLKPRALSKKSTHESRIYFSLDKNTASRLWDSLKWYIPRDRGVLLTIDTEKLNANFYNDPNFNKLGVYTYANIPPSAIVKYEQLQEN
jgi:hypothetical protein